MRKILFKLSIFILFLTIVLIGVLSTIGVETDKFSKIISSKVIENNKNIYLKLEKVKFKFDIKSLNLFLETKYPILKYKNETIPIKDIKVYLNFASLIKSKSKIEKIDLTSEEIDIEKLKKIILKTKPSNLNSLINNRVKNGKISINLELFFKNNLEINNFIARGDIRDLEGIINDKLILKKTNFNFFADSSDILIKNLKSSLNGLKIDNGNLLIKNDKQIKVKSEFSTRINLDESNIKNYSPLLNGKNFINNKTKLKATLENFIDITFDKTFKVIDYVYTNKGKIENSLFYLDKSFASEFLEKEIKFINFIDTNIQSRYASDDKNSFFVSGKYSINDDNFKEYSLKNNFNKKAQSINLNLKIDQILKLNFINYKKDFGKIANISLNFEVKKDKINVHKFIFKEGKNSISVEKLKIKKQKLVSLENIKVKTFNENYVNNDFSLKFGNNIKVIGLNYDAKNFNKFLNQKSNNDIFKNITKDIEININNIDTPLSEKLKNFRLIGSLKNGKFVKISSKGDFGNNKFLDISMKSDKNNNKKYLEIYSDLPQPLLSEFTFFKGLAGGELFFSSIIDSNISTSTSKLTIDNFKVVNAPGVVKLLSLADFGGLADLAEGEGLSFEKMEINISKKKGLMELNELYAVGPSISVLMEGYKEDNGLTSLRGTLVPAKNLNKFLSKIPVIGKIIIPEEVGEGLFGVSFKMKGMPGKIKTTINPIKTLTPRFITKALEKTKKSK